MHVEQIALFIPIVSVICVFTFISIASWADARRKEREAYYKNETLKKIAESQGQGATSALELMREEERIAVRRAREGQRLGGLVTLGVGIALTSFLWAILDRNEKGVALVGLFPFLVGVALLIYSYVLAPKENQ
jgi:hypothetical protein